MIGLWAEGLTNLSKAIGLLLRSLTTTLTSPICTSFWINLHGLNLFFFLLDTIFLSRRRKMSWPLVRPVRSVQAAVSDLIGGVPIGRTLVVSTSQIQTSSPLMRWWMRHRIALHPNPLTVTCKTWKIQCRRCPWHCSIYLLGGNKAMTSPLRLLGPPQGEPSFP